MLGKIPALLHHQRTQDDYVMTYRQLVWMFKKEAIASTHRSPVVSTPKLAGDPVRALPVPEIAIRQDPVTPVSSQSAGEVKEGEELELKIWTQTIDCFFNHFFFPTFEHYQLVSSYIHQS